MRKYLIVLVILCAVLATACGKEEPSSVKRDRSDKVTKTPDKNDPTPGEQDPTPTPAKPSAEEFKGHYNNNLFSTAGLVVEDEGRTFFLEDERKTGIQCLYSIADNENAEPVLLMKIPEYNEDGYMIPLNFGCMVGYGNMLYMVDGHDRDNATIYYCAKDGSSFGKFGTLPGLIAREGASQVGSKVYFVSYPYRDYYDERLGDCADKPTLYVMDLEKKSIDPVPMSVNLGEFEHIRIAGVTSEAVYYVLCGKLDCDLKGFYRYDLKTGENTSIAKRKSEDLEKLTMAGQYILHELDGDVYSLDVMTGETYRVVLDASLRSDVTVVDDTIYYLVDETNLYSCSIRGENKKLVAKRSGDSHYDKKTLATSGDWIYYMMDHSFYRMKRDSSVFPSEEQSLVAPPKAAVELEDGVFIPNPEIFGQPIAQLDQYFGSVPTPDVWEWEGGYDSFTDIYYNGDQYTLFFLRGKLHAVRYEFYAYDIPQHLVEEYTARYGSYQMRTDSYGNVIPVGINGYGYRFRTDNGYLDLFYNFYDEQPHTAIHFSLY